MIHIAVTTRPTNKTTVSQDIAEGLALAWNTPVLLSLFTVLGIVTFCTKPYTQFMPVFARDILQVGAPGLGLLLMAPGAGAILGGLTLASIRRFPRPHYLLFFLAAGFGSSIIFFAASRHFLLSLFFYFSPVAFRPLFFPPLRPCCKSKALKPTAAE
jgi:predicted MFS family arabinose efflux permease